MDTSEPHAKSETQRRLEALLDEMASRPRPVRIVKKRACWHQRAAARALWVLTLGGQRTYLSKYTTTLGHTIYVPDGFDAWSSGRALRTLRHEMVHVRQFERYGWPLMILLYGLLPLPAGLAFFRARFEWEAYTETLRATAESRGLAAARKRRLHKQIIRRFTGPDYGWMWPFPRMVQRWIDGALVAIERDLAR